MGFRLLCTGDVHLGRSPARIPDTLPAQQFSTAATWRAFVDKAIELGVDAAVLTGDIVDENNRFYEAFSPLETGVRKLVGEGIEVLAVAGNHDYDVLPRLAELIPEVHLLGRGGRWEEIVIGRAGAQKIRFLGWSFPTRHFSGDCLAGLTPPRDELPTIGLLHCDCNVPNSAYAPVSLDELRNKAVDAWILGHIHKPDQICAASPLVVYPGSPQGLDPGEPGPHGALLVTVEPGRRVTAELLPLAALRWESVEIPLEEVVDRDALDAAIIDALARKHDEIRGELASARAVGCRMRLRGRTPVHRQLPDLLPAICDDLRRELDGVEYFIEKVVDESRPDVNLEDLARSTDPAGLLASRLILLERREPAIDYQALIGRARAAVAAKRFPSGRKEITDDQLRELLIMSGLTMMDELLRQKESPE